MTSQRCAVGLALALAFLAGCDSNPEGPRAPADALSKAAAEGRSTTPKAVRRPVTRNRREIVNPE